MLNNPILQTAIGLVFVFLGFSLITTALQEAIASFLRLRAVTLRSGLQQMLTQGEQGIQFYNKLMAHPVIKPAGSLPSYISARQFSTAAVHIITGSASVPASVASLRIAVLNLPDSPFKTTLVSLFREGENEFDSFEKRLQGWFDESMDRVSGVYKRWSQYISLAIGLVLAFLFQADAVAIAHSLWTEPYLRDEIVRKAGDLAKSSASGASSLPDIDTVAPGLILFHPGAAPHWTIVPGCLITAFAITLGAPFWFDLLQQFVSLRGTGPVPVRSTTNAS